MLVGPCSGPGPTRKHRNGCPWEGRRAWKLIQRPARRWLAELKRGAGLLLTATPAASVLDSIWQGDGDPAAGGALPTERWRPGAISESLPAKPERRSPLVNLALYRAAPGVHWPYGRAPLPFWIQPIGGRRLAGLGGWSHAAAAADETCLRAGRKDQNVHWRAWSGEAACRRFPVGRLFCRELKAGIHRPPGVVNTADPFPSTLPLSTSLAG